MDACKPKAEPAINTNLETVDFISIRVHWRSFAVEGFGFEFREDEVLRSAHNAGLTEGREGRKEGQDATNPSCCGYSGSVILLFFLMYRAEPSRPSLRPLRFSCRSLCVKKKLSGVGAAGVPRIAL